MKFSVLQGECQEKHVEVRMKQIMALKHHFYSINRLNRITKVPNNVKVQHMCTNIKWKRAL